MVLSLRVPAPPSQNGLTQEPPWAFQDSVSVHVRVMVQQCGVWRVRLGVLLLFAPLALDLVLLVMMRARGRSVVVGRYDEAVPGDLHTRRKEALGIDVTRLVRQMNQVGAARPHGLDDVDGL